MYEDALSLRDVLTFQAHSNTIWRIRQSPFNSAHVATCSSDSTVKIWDATANWTLVRSFEGHSKSVLSVEFLDEDTIASGSWDYTIQIWSIRTGLIRTTINLYVSLISSLKLLSNGIHLAAGLDNGPINIYDINTGSLISILRGHLSNVYDLAMISKTLMASSCLDKTIRIWDLTTKAEKFILKGHTSYVYGLNLISLDVLASSSDDQTIKLWNTTSGDLIRTLSNHTNWIYFSIDLLDNDNGQGFVSGAADKTIKLWNWNTGECLNTIDTGLNIISLATIKS